MCAYTKPINQVTGWLMPFSSYSLQDISGTGQTQRLWVLRLKLPSAPSKNSTLFEYQTNATSAQEFLGLFFLQKS
jgi:hypothetical protein